MYKNILLLLIMLMTNNLPAQVISGDSIADDDEQKQLEYCYAYSNLFGYDIDTIENPTLYNQIGEWLGTHYCFSGESKKGIDCSGFVSVLYKNVFQIELEGSAAAIYKHVKALKKDELHEGDLVFFKIRKRRVSHVGIYLGQNKFAHASVKSGVIVSDLDEAYYHKYFYRGGRIN
jgi:lipoprotein Spr